MANKTWEGTAPEKCDLCGCHIRTEFVDGVVAGRTTWAIMCSPCHSKFGSGLGTGKGQKYILLRMAGLNGFVQVAG